MTALSDSRREVVVAVVAVLAMFGAMALSIYSDQPWGESRLFEGPRSVIFPATPQGEVVVSAPSSFSEFNLLFGAVALTAASAAICVLHALRRRGADSRLRAVTVIAGLLALTALAVNLPVLRHVYRVYG